MLELHGQKENMGINIYKMDTLTHLKLSSILIDGLEKNTNAKISRFGFKIGSIMPDMGPHLRFKQHHISESGKHVNKHISKLQNKQISSFKASYILGKTSHYLSDTFCFAHNHELGKSLKLHYLYEKNMFIFLKNMSDFSHIREAFEKSMYVNVERNCLVSYIHEQNHRYMQNYEGLSQIESVINDIYHVCLYNFYILSEMIFRSFGFSCILEK